MNSLRSRPLLFKSLILLGVLAVVAALIPFSVPIHAGDPPLRKITVTGEATVPLVPDELHWTIDVHSSDVTQLAAKTKLDTVLTSALQILKASSGELKDLETLGLHIIRTSTVTAPGKPSVVVVTCTTTITFTLLNFAKYVPLSDALAKLEGVDIHDPQYASSKLAETRREALKQALFNAREKANDLATASGCYIDRPLSIEEKETVSASPQAVTAMVSAQYDLFYR